MPTLNPRTNVTLSPSLDLLVQRLASHQRSSKSQVLRELLEAAEPALQRAVALMDAASTASASVRSGLARSLNMAQDVAEQQLAGHLEHMDATTDLVSQAEAIKGRKRAPGPARARAEPVAPAPEARKRPANPRPVTRGLGIPKGGRRGSV
jgi:hypothetical protein